MDLPWKLQQPIDAVVFDCDGTLSRIEGIDVLAAQNGVGEVVSRMTETAMSTTGVSMDLYAERLALVQPTSSQVRALGQAYFDQRIPDVVEVIHILQQLGKSIYVMSAGLKPSVSIFAQRLNIPEENVFAVDICFDETGDYLEFDQASPLTNVGGKRRLVQDLKKKHTRIIHIGDGMNDVDVKGEVCRFIGYGGVFYRDAIREQSDYYIQSPSLLPLLPLVLTEGEMYSLSHQEKQMYQQGIRLMPYNGGR